MPLETGVEQLSPYRKLCLIRVWQARQRKLSRICRYSRRSESLSVRSSCLYERRWHTFIKSVNVRAELTFHRLHTHSVLLPWSPVSNRMISAEGCLSIFVDVDLNRTLTSLTSERTDAFMGQDAAYAHDSIQFSSVLLFFLHSLFPWGLIIWVRSRWVRSRLPKPVYS